MKIGKSVFLKTIQPPSNVNPTISLTIGLVLKKKNRGSKLRKEKTNS